MFGNIDYLRIFVKAYVSALTYLKTGPWYAEADMKTGSTTYFQFNSLQSFWPGNFLSILCFVSLLHFKKKKVFKF